MARKRSGPTSCHDPSTSVKRRSSRSRAMASTERTAPASMIVRQVLLEPRRADHVQRAATPELGAACRKKGQPKQWSAWKCETTTTSMSPTANPQRRRCGSAVGLGSTSTEVSITKLFQ